MKIGSTWKRLDTRRDIAGDGCFQGQGGKLYPGDTPLDQVEPVGAGGPRGRVVFFNGIMTDQALQNEVHERLSQQGYAVVGVRNATEGFAKDLKQCVADKLNLDQNPATRTAMRLMEDSVTQGRPLHLIGHSQGSLILSNAVKRLSARWRKEGLGSEQIQERLGLLEITTIGGATFRYPPGPRYHHVVNWLDPVTWMAGVTAFSWLTCEPGEVRHFTEMKRPHGLPPVSDGLVNLFCRFTDSTVHGPREIYSPQL